MRALLAVTGCVLAFSAQTVQAEPASFAQMGKTGVFVFDPERSTVTEEGGIAGIHEVYPIEGQFVLTVDLATHTASLGPVDANLTRGSPYLQAGVNLGDLYSMSELIAWYFKNDKTIEFQGEPNNGSWVMMTLSLTTEGAHLTGRMIDGGLRCADCFTFDVNAVATYAYGGGRGEPNHPYRIYTPEQMNAIGAEPNDWNKHFKLMVDIDLGKYKGMTFNSTGYWTTRQDFHAFAGGFDGSGHKISNFTYVRSGIGFTGLWGYVQSSDAKIANLVLVDPNVSGEKDNVGSLVGCLESGTVLNCRVEGGHVSGRYGVGGLVGWSNGGRISSCSAICNVIGSTDAGGLVGFCSGGAVLESVSGGSVVSTSLEDSAGGLVGGTDSARHPHIDITNCHSHAKVSGTRFIGGLVGMLGPGDSVTNCYSTGSVSGKDCPGGLIGFAGSQVGYYTPEVNASFWDVEATGQTHSAAGVGKTTAEMQTAQTFLEAGWDFVDETANGTEDLWWIEEGKDYPRLTWERMSTHGPGGQ